MAEPPDMIPPLLRDLRDELKSGFDRMDQKFAENDVRFDNLRQAVYGELVLGRYAVAEVQERLERSRIASRHWKPVPRPR